MMPIDRIFALALGRRPGARRSVGRSRRGPRREAARLSAQALEPRVVFAGIPSFVADINRTTPGSMPADFTVIGQTAFFSADDGQAGTELFRTDGTSAGTIRILDLNPGAEGSFPRELTAVGGTLFFLADVDSLGSQLFRSDGTAAGTVRVEDVGSGSGPVLGLPLPRNAFNLTAAGTSLYFCADDGSKGVELWVSDGTRAGTTVVADINPGTLGSFPSELTSFGTRLVFSADDGTHGRELWVSDGTRAGTFMVGDLNADLPDSSPTGMTVVGAQVFFAATGSSIGRELYRWDGSDNGPILVADILGTEGSSDPQNLTAVGAALFFTAEDRSFGRELWTSDGTAAGTRLVADIVAGADSSQPTDLTAVGDTLFFTVSIPSPLGAQADLWRSRGTATDTVRVTAPSAPGAFALPRRLTAMGNELFFFAGGQQLLKAGPSSTQATLVRDIDPARTANDVTSASYGAMAVLGGKLLFGADDGQSGDELWISDGTTANTGLLRDIRSSVTNDGLDSSASFAAVAVNGTLYFAADDGSHGMELWKTDGTAAGT
ncbi:MAG: hypothetical protein EBZ59_08900, partial [Planctomycetia bacterium]|nr:hypothetical protein [Planctomycetia bacterium]